MAIKDNCKVTLVLTLKADDGEVIADYSESSPLVYTHGNGELMKGVEQALEGQKAGYEFDLTIEPALAFGEYDPSAVQTVSITAFEDVEDLHEGMQLYAGTPEGPVPVFVRSIDSGMVAVDGNPFYAGHVIWAKGKVLNAEL